MKVGRMVYCHTCRGFVWAITERCPFCSKLLWEALATDPFDFHLKLRTTRATYAAPEPEAEKKI